MSSMHFHLWCTDVCLCCCYNYYGRGSRSSLKSRKSIQGGGAGMDNQVKQVLDFHSGDFMYISNRSCRNNVILSNNKQLFLPKPKLICGLMTMVWCCRCTAGAMLFWAMLTISLFSHLVVRICWFWFTLSTPAVSFSATSDSRFLKKATVISRKPHCTPPAQQEPVDRHSWRLAGDLVEHLAANETDIPLRSM